MKKTLLICISMIALSINAFSQTWSTISNNFYTNPITTKVGIGTGTTVITRLCQIHNTTGNNHLFITGTDPAIAFSNAVSGSEMATIGLATVAGHFVGSAAANDFIIRTPTSTANILFATGTSSTEVMRISSTGNVGIGTTIPYAKLNVAGNSVFTATSSSITSAAYIRGLNTYSTATTPDYTWYNNDQTGIFHPVANNLGFTIAGNEKMRIISNGNVGIGTTTPNDVLEVNGNISVTGGGATGNSWLNGRKTYNHDAQVDNYFGLNYNTSITNGPSIYMDETGYVHLQSYNAGAAILFQGYTGSTLTTQMAIQASGNVGIGTAAPAQSLEVAGSISVYNPTKNGNTSLFFGREYVSNNYGKWGIQYQTAGQIGTGSLGGLNFWIPFGPNNALFLADNGNVGIGTSNPGNYLLAVKGIVHAQEVDVDMNNWSDYVFEKSFKLKTLNEVESYINLNKHLPDVPSAKDVKDNGIKLGEMDAKLLQKVEELTLYVIELQKQVNDLKSH